MTSRVEAFLAKERAAGLDRLDAYRSFAEKVKRVKCDVLAIPDQRRAGKGKRSPATALPPKATHS